MRIGTYRRSRLVKQPAHDSRIEPFRDGIGVLSQHGEFAGHIATKVTQFWSPSSPLKMNWWVFYIVVWADGTREPPAEDYGPVWTTVGEMNSGYFDFFAHRSTRNGRYQFAWLDSKEAASIRHMLKIDPKDF